MTSQTDQTPDLAALEALAEAATPGPWSVGRHRDGHAVAIDDADGYSDVVGPGPVDCMAYCYGGVSTIEWTDATAAYIAAADPQTVLWLIREVERLRRIGSEWTSNYESWVSATRAAERERDALIERVRALVADWQANGNSRPLGDRAADVWHHTAHKLLAVLDGGE